MTIFFSTRKHISLHTQLVDEEPTFLEPLLMYQLYTQSNKNPSARNFLSPEPEVTCGTVAIII